MTKIKDLSEREFLELLQSLKKNYIEVGGICVESSTEDLKTVEETADRLLKKHSDFLLLKRIQKIKGVGD